MKWLMFTRIYLSETPVNKDSAEMFIVCPWNFLHSIHLYHPNSFPVSLVDILRLFERLLEESFFDFSSNQFTDQLASQYTNWQSVQKVDLI